MEEEMEGVEGESWKLPKIPDSERRRIVAQLPEDWTKGQVDDFIKTYYEKLPAQTAAGIAAMTEVEATDPEPDVVDVPSPNVVELETSGQSRKGLTLDTTVIVDGRSVTIRAIHEAGQLHPFKALVWEGPARRRTRRVLYAARLLDRNRVFVITPETYRFLAPEHNDVVPHDEPLPPAAVKNIQSRVSVVDADTMERNLP